MNPLPQSDVYDRYFIEIQMVLRRYQHTAAKLDGDLAKLLVLRREENEALRDLLEQQRRALAFAAGEPVEPTVQFAKSIVSGRGT